MESLFELDELLMELQKKKNEEQHLNSQIRHFEERKQITQDASLNTRKFKYESTETKTEEKNSTIFTPAEKANIIHRIIKSIKTKDINTELFSTLNTLIQEHKQTEHKPSQQKLNKEKPKTKPKTKKKNKKKTKQNNKAKTKEKGKEIKCDTNSEEESFLFYLQEINVLDQIQLLHNNTHKQVIILSCF